MTRSRAEYRDLLRGGGLRATAPRVAVLEVLAKQARPMTHGDVADALDEEGFDRATLYRNLVDLATVGIVKRNDYGDHVWRFELAGGDDPTNHGHAHFICRECGSVECLPADTVAIHASRKAPKALRRRKLQVELRGLCDTCG